MSLAYIIPLPSLYLDAANPPVELSDSSEGEIILDPNRPFLSRVYRRRFKLTALAPQFGPLFIVSALQSSFGVQPGCAYQLGSSGLTYYELDPWAFCTRIIPRRASDDGCTWTVDAQWETIDPQTFSTFSNPLSKPIEIAIDGQQYEKIVDVTIPNATYPSGQPILNSANDPFDPGVTREDSRTIITVTRNEAAYDAGSGSGFNPASIDGWRDTTNKYTFFGYAPKCVKLVSVSARQEWHPYFYDTTSTPPNPGYYWAVTYTFQVDKNTWDKKVLDAGYRTYDSTAKVWHQIVIDGVPATAPVPLNGSGQMQAPDSGGLIQGVYRDFEVLAETDFGATFGFGT